MAPRGWIQRLDDKRRRDTASGLKEAGFLLTSWFCVEYNTGMLILEAEAFHKFISFRILSVSKSTGSIKVSSFN